MTFQRNGIVEPNQSNVKTATLIQFCLVYQSKTKCCGLENLNFVTAKADSKARCLHALRRAGVGGEIYMSSPPPSPPLPSSGEGLSSPTSRSSAVSPARPQQQDENAYSPSQASSHQDSSNGARSGHPNGTRSSRYSDGDHDSPPRSPMSGLDGDGVGSPVRSAPPTPSSNFSPHGFSGSLPRTPLSTGARSLPSTPRTPFTPIDMQVCYRAV